MSENSSSVFLDSLVAIVGRDHVLVDGDLSAYETDWRRRTTGKALAVVRPKTTQEVASVAAACKSAYVSMVVQGGNTGLAEGGIPDASGKQVVIQLGRMNAIRRIDAHNLTVTVEAGCILQNLQSAVKEAGFLFPLSLGAEGSCMIGGNLATNAGGTQVLRYGNTRELCLGLEVITPEGEVWNGLSGLRKDNTGYDLRDLFVGSEGTLGIITAATLKIFPAPAAVLTAWVALPTVEKAIDLLGLAQQKLGPSLTGFELMGNFGLSLVAKHMPQFRIPFLEQKAPYNVLLECSDAESEAHARAAFERLLEIALENELIDDAVIAESVAQAEQLWHIREHITLAQAEEGPNVKHDVSVPISSIAAFVTASEEALQANFPGVRLVNFGHLGDGNLHFNVQAPEGQDTRQFVAQMEESVMDVVYQQVKRFGGSFSAEHGVGAIKVEKLHQYKCPTALKLMRIIKVALDPSNLMNPGRVLGPLN